MTARPREHQIEEDDVGTIVQHARETLAAVDRERDPDEAFDRSIDVHVSHLRKKLGDDPRCPRILKTVRGIGYLFAFGGE